MGSIDNTVFCAMRQFQRQQTASLQRSASGTGQQHASLSVAIFALRQGELRLISAAAMMMPSDTEVEAGALGVVCSALTRGVAP